MFKNSWTRQTAFLGDVPDEHDGDVSLLGFLHQPIRTAANLYHRARSASQARVGDGLDAVDDDERRLDRVECRDDVGNRGFGQQPQVVLQCPQTLGTETNLLSTFLCRDIQ